MPSETTYTLQQQTAIGEYQKSGDLSSLQFLARLKYLRSFEMSSEIKIQQFEILLTSCLNDGRIASEIVLGLVDENTLLETARVVDLRTITLVEQFVASETSHNALQNWRRKEGKYLEIDEGLQFMAVLLYAVDAGLLDKKKTLVDSSSGGRFIDLIWYKRDWVRSVFFGEYYKRTGHHFKQEKEFSNMLLELDRDVASGAFDWQDTDSYAEPLRDLHTMFTAQRSAGEPEQSRTEYISTLISVQKSSMGSNAKIRAYLSPMEASSALPLLNVLDILEAVLDQKRESYVTYVK